jgi:hypothetical protein
MTEKMMENIIRIGENNQRPKEVEKYENEEIDLDLKEKYDFNINFNKIPVLTGNDQKENIKAN